jgi:hypothetical protein
MTYREQLIFEVDEQLAIDSSARQIVKAVLHILADAAKDYTPEAEEFIEAVTAND